MTAINELNINGEDYRIEDKFTSEALEELQEQVTNTKLTMVTSLPLSPVNGDVVLYTGTDGSGLVKGGIYQYQDSEWVLISGRDTADIYSTAEVKTNRVWVDGKPIYRKTYTNIPLTPSSYVRVRELGIQGLNEIVKIDGVCRSGTLAESIGNQDPGFTHQFYIGDGAICANVGTNEDWNVGQATITVEYTKTN